VSVLTGPEIERVVAHTRRCKGDGIPIAKLRSLPWIDVEPWRPEFAGPNSLDVHLADTLLRYDLPHGRAINPSSPPKTTPLATVLHGGLECWLLYPNTLYLGATEERIECHGVVPWIDGRSSIGRLGVSVHVTAGRGDDGWPGHGRPPAPFTLEITVVHPTILRPGMRVAQLTFMQTTGERRPYAGRYGDGAGPVPSRFYLPDVRPPEQPGY
jgi:dCTP deaminase